MSEEVKPELVDRMAALVRKLSEVRRGHDTHPGKWFGINTELGDEACAIVDLLAPLDPDVEIACDIVRFAYPDMKDNYAGRRFQIALCAIKRGRQLALATTPARNTSQIGEG